MPTKQDPGVAPCAGSDTVTWPPETRSKSTVTLIGSAPSRGAAAPNYPCPASATPVPPEAWHCLIGSLCALLGEHQRRILLPAWAPY